MAFTFFQNGCARKTESLVCNTRSARNYLAEEGQAIRETMQMLQNMTETQKKIEVFEDAQVEQNSDDDETFEEADDSFDHVVSSKAQHQFLTVSE